MITNDRMGRAEIQESVVYQVKCYETDGTIKKDHQDSSFPKYVASPVKTDFLKERTFFHYTGERSKAGTKGKICPILTLFDKVT